MIVRVSCDEYESTADYERSKFWKWNDCCELKDIWQLYMNDWSIWQQGSTEKREMWLMKYDWCNMTDTMTVIERMNVKRVIIEMKEYNNYE